MAEITVNNQWGRVIREYAESRGPGYAAERGVYKAAQYVISFALRKGRIPVADRAEIKARLMAPVGRGKFAVQATKQTKTGKESKASRYRELKGSLAAYLVQLTNYKNARSKEAGEFYGIVGRFIAARQRSAGYHRAGLIPAMKAFRTKREEAGGDLIAKLRYYPGSASLPSAADDVVTARLTNFARAIETIAGGAFAEAEMEAMVEMRKWTQQNLAESMARAGIGGRR